MTKITKKTGRYRYKIPDLINVAQLIDTACGYTKENVVNFKLIEVVLVILARQLNMLQRRVRIELPEYADYISKSKICVTVIKIHAKVKKKRRLPVVQLKTSPSKSMIGAANISRPAQRSLSKTSVVKSGSSLHEILSTPEEEEQSLSFDFMDSILLTIKTTSGETETMKSHKLEKSIVERLLTWPETSKDDDSTKHKKKAKDSAGPKKSGTEKTTTDISSTDKTSTDESTIMSFLAKYSSSSPDKTSFDKSSLERSEELTSSTKQRSYLQSSPEISSVSMDTSTDTIEDQYENIFFVKRVSSEESEVRAGRLQSDTRGCIPRLSIITQEEFNELTADVRKLQAKLNSTGNSDYPEHLLKIIRKHVAWPDGIAALQISARLEVTEKALERMMSLVTDLATRYPEIDTTSLYQVHSDTASDSKTIYQGDTSSGSQIRITSQESVQNPITTPNVSLVSEKKESLGIAVTEDDFVTQKELQTALEGIYDSVTNPFTQTIDKSLGDANTAFLNVIKLDTKVNAALAADKQMMQLESLVAKYADKINTIDARISFETTKYQDEIINMQYALQLAVDNMIQMMAPTKEDIEAKAELISSFNSFRVRLDETYAKQLDLEEVHSACETDVEILSEQIGTIIRTKSDRDEVIEALRGKVGFESLNCMVFLEFFYAIRGNLEEQITFASYKFAMQEFYWQKTIDDLVKSLEEKADQTQVVSLEKDIMFHINKLRTRLSAMQHLLGEHQLTSFSKKMHRDTKCLSCSTPACVKETVVPRLPYLAPNLGVESGKKNKEVHGVCFPGLPVLHSRDPRAHVCHRYCGGPSSKHPKTASRIPPGTIIKSVGRELPDARTLYNTTKKPCIPCNIKPKVEKDRTPNESAAKLSDNVVNNENSDMISTDFRRRS